VESPISPSFLSLRFFNIDTTPITGINTITPQKFEECLKYLRNNGYYFLKSKEVYDFFINKVPVPEKSIWLTFDDGMKSSYKATDLLKKYNAKATIFVAITWIKKTYRLGDTELLSMSKSGIWDIQSSGFTGNLTYPINQEDALGNFYTNKLWQIGQVETTEQYKIRIKKDLIDAFSYIKTNFNSDKLLFAYPFTENLKDLTDREDIANSFIECLNELKIIGISSRLENGLSNDWSNKMHFVSRYDVDNQTNFSTLLSATYTGKKVEYINKAGDLLQMKNATIFDGNKTLFWDDPCNFIYADTFLQPYEPEKNLTEKFSKICTKCLKPLASNLGIAVISPDIIFVLYKDNNILYKTNTTSNELKKIRLNIHPISIWQKDGEVYFLDKLGVVYNAGYNGLSPIKFGFDTGVTGSSSAISSCAKNEFIYIVDNMNKLVRKIDYITGKEIKSIPFPERYSLVAQYVLKDNEFISFESNSNVFVKVKLKY
jgi:hypothetical protein